MQTLSVAEEGGYVAQTSTGSSGASVGGTASKATFYFGVLMDSQPGQGSSAGPEGKPSRQSVVSRLDSTADRNSSGELAGAEVGAPAGPA